MASPGQPGASRPPFPLPPTFPPGVNPETYEADKVTRLLKSAAYYPIFNVPNPTLPNRPIPLFPGLNFLMIAVEVNEELHRFDVKVCDPGAGRRLKALNTVGAPVANVHIRWTPIPDDFQGAPGRLPPPTILNPFVSQRFTMLDGQLSFKDAGGTGFRAYGTGRTFPSIEGGGPVLRIGAVIDVLEALGKFKGLSGAACINGFIQPPDNLALNLVVRMMDPEGRLLTQASVPPIQPGANSDPNAVFMYFQGEVNPDIPVKLNIAPDGTILGSQVNELLRLVELTFDGQSMRSRRVEGPVVGQVTANLYFNPLDPRPVSPIQTTDGVFTFFDAKRGPIGTVQSNMVEGRAMRSELPGAPMPVFRFAGFGPITGGTGAFDGADGMMSMNSAISIFPRTLSNLYILRFYDPRGRFREQASRAWPLQ